jgi:NAD(P)-dependent dehydrogenase (short-subunit alcohol dehydrogenase family)
MLNIKLGIGEETARVLAKHGAHVVLGMENITHPLSLASNSLLVRSIH